MVWSLESADCCPTLVSTDWMLLEFSQDTTSAGELGAPVSSHRSSLLLSLVLVTYIYSWLPGDGIFTLGTLFTHIKLA